MRVLTREAAERAIRERAGYTLEEVEEAALVPRFTLRRIGERRAKVKTKTARRIAGALGTTVAALAEQGRG